MRLVQHIKRHITSIGGGLVTAFYGVIVWASAPAQAADPLGFFDKMLPKPDAAAESVGTGEFAVKDIVLHYMAIFKGMVAILSILFIVILGYRMITAGGNEETIKKSRSGVIWTLVGLVIMQVAGSFVSTLYGSEGNYKVLDDYKGDVPQDLRQNVIEPILKYFLTFVAAIAVIMVVLSGLRMIFAAGDDGKIKKQQQVLLGSLTGLVIILIARPLIAAFYGYEEVKPDPKSVIGIIMQITNYVLGFVAILAILMLIYAGFLMVLHFGNDALVQKARKIITWVLIGLALIISAYTIVTLFIMPTVV